MQYNHGLACTAYHLSVYKFALGLQAVFYIKQQHQNRHSFHEVAILSTLGLNIS